MDLLKALNFEDLPEQQTRTSHLTESQPDFQLALGFDACCNCGKANPTIECDVCHRVKYCSKECLEQDSSPPKDMEEEEALGHSALICSILNTCNDDEAVDDGDAKSLQEDKRTAAIDRNISEFESYPATLANVLMDGPCYQGMLHKCAGGDVTIHVIGASVDSELWEGHPEVSSLGAALKGYAEALAEIAESHKLKSINLQFIGPDCPESDKQIDVEFPAVRKSKSSCVLKVTTIKKDYNNETLKGDRICDANFVVFFNPGFTCPDYNWDDAIKALRKGTPFLITTNTEVEGMADLQHLVDRNLMQEVPGAFEAMFADMDLSDETEPEPELQDKDCFFSVNPFCGNRVRQSGTMANDLYVKNRWMFGGIIGEKTRHERAEQPAKRTKVEGSGNSKKANPALI